MASTVTSIEWCDVTWNPVRGCTRVSPGCFNCYAEKTANRFGGPGKPYEGLVKKVNGHPQWTGNITVSDKALKEPLTWKGSKKVFVNSMSDLFHPNVPADFIEEIWKVIKATPHHTYQILTKRPERIKNNLPLDWGSGYPNVWLGVSVENQEYADKRIPLLLQIPAKVRFLSCEPLLGWVNIRNEWFGRYTPPGPFSFGGRYDEMYLHWVIAGGESGSKDKARPAQLLWFRTLREECQSAGVPFFFKQMGGSSKINGHWGGNLLDGKEYTEMPEVAQ